MKWSSRILLPEEGENSQLQHVLGIEIEVNTENGRISLITERGHIRHQIILSCENFHKLTTFLMELAEEIKTSHAHLRSDQ